MRLDSLTLGNFRAYQNSTTLNFGELTTVIGRNDIGKSSILEALDIFFNGSTIDQGDANVRSGTNDVTLRAEFSDLPSELTLDSGAKTTLAGEFLLHENKRLVIEKVYDCGKSKPSCDVYIIAAHPSEKGYHNLLEQKENDLRSIIKEKGIQAPLKGNPGMRKAIWDSCPDLKLKETRIPVSKPKEDSKRIWEQIEAHLPLYALFQADRPSKDSDEEVQNPLKGAVQAAIAEVQPEIEAIQQKVRERSMEIAALTHTELKRLDPALAQALVPKFSPPAPSKWVSLFSVGMDTDERIPLNKRGSGVRRLILVSFFKAEAERKLRTSNKANIIYAIEEPETSQHPHN